MTFFTRSIEFYIILALTTFLSGCSDKTQTMHSVVQETKVAEVKEAKAKEIKPGAPIKLLSPAVISINANEKSHIEIVLETRETTGELTLELSPPVELDLLDTPITTVIDLTSSASIKIPLSLLAAVNGRYYLKMRARISNGDVSSIRNLALIIQVGPLADKAAQLKKISGENVISLPAQETISTQ